MKKILVFIDWYLPGYKAGGPIRSVANMVAHLSEKLQFYIVTTNTDYLETKPYQKIKSDEWNRLSENENVYYFSKENLSNKSLKILINKTEFDIAYINGTYSLYFSILPLILAKRFKNKKVIVAPRGMFSAQGLGVKSLKKQIFVNFCRLIGIYKKTVFQVTSNTEEQDIMNLKLKPDSIFQIPNLPPKTDISKIVEIEKETSLLKLISIARIAPEKNTLFALNCLKNFEYNGTIMFDLYGSIYNQNYWEECVAIIKKLPENIKVIYHGELDNQLIKKTLKAYHFSFLPSKGENFGHSILESLLSGRPVIIGNTTPWKKLEENNAGWDIDLKKPEVFAEKISLALSMDNTTYQGMMKNALKFAILNTNLEETKQKYYELFS